MRWAATRLTTPHQWLPGLCRQGFLTKIGAPLLKCLMLAQLRFLTSGGVISGSTQYTVHLSRCNPTQHLLHLSSPRPAQEMPLMISQHLDHRKAPTISADKMHHFDRSQSECLLDVQCFQCQIVCFTFTLNERHLSIINQMSRVFTHLTLCFMNLFFIMKVKLEI